MDNLSDHDTDDVNQWLDDQLHAQYRAMSPTKADQAHYGYRTFRAVTFLGRDGGSR